MKLVIKYIVGLTVILLTICLLPVLSNAGDWVAAGGVTFDKRMGNPGAGFLMGQEYVLDESLGLKARILYVKNNWTDTTLFNLDHLEGQIGKYWTLTEKHDIRLAAHGAFDFYDESNNNLGGLVGGEIRGNIVPKLDMFVSGDAILRPGANFFLITCGVIVSGDIFGM